MKFWSICKNTFLQTVRRPVFAVLIAVAIGMFVISVPLSGWTMGTTGADYRRSDQLMLENMGISTLLIMGLGVAAFSASTALSREIEQRTVLTVVSKPVSRATFVLGKFAGVALAVTVAYYIASLVFLLTVRHGVMPTAGDKLDWPAIVLGLSALGLTFLGALVGNYLFGWSFTSAAVTLAAVLLTVAMGVVSVVGEGWVPVTFGAGIRSQLITGIVLTWLAVFVLSAVAVAASTRLGTVAILLVSLGVLLLGWVHPLLFDRWADDVPAMRLAGWVIPDLRLLDPQDPLTDEKPISASYVLLATAYAIGYSAAALAVGIALFQTRPLEARTSSSLPGVVGLLAGLGRALSLATALVGAVLLTVPAMHSPWGVLLCAGLVAGGVVGWFVWGAFGHGKRWAYGLIVAIIAIKLVRVSVVLLLPGDLAEAVRLARIDNAVSLVLQLVALAGILVLLALPKVRRHFRTSSPVRA
jgi:hypothetical protein